MRANKNIENIDDVNSYLNQYETQEIDDNLDSFISQYDTDTLKGINEEKQLQDVRIDEQKQDLGQVQDLQPVKPPKTADTAQDTQDTLVKKEDGMISKIVKDISKGVAIEGFSAAKTGVKKAVNEMAEIGGDAVDFLGDTFAKGVIGLVGDQEQKDRLKAILEKKAAQKDEKLFETDYYSGQRQEPITLTGNIIEDIAQFMTGFGVAGKMLKGIKATTKAGKVAKAATTLGSAEIIAFDDQEERLSNLIEKYPELQNPVTEFLQAKKEDPQTLAKFKQAIEGLSLGVAGEGIFKAVRAIKSFKNVKNKANIEVVRPATEPKKAVEIDKLVNEKLGDVKITDVRKELTEPQQLVYTKISQAAKETKDLSPQEATKLTQRKPQSADEIQINFSKLQNPEDIQNAMAGFANQLNLLPKVKEARRGVRSNKVTLKVAEDVDAFDSLISRREGQPLNAEQITAARQFYSATSNKLVELAEAAASPTASQIDQFAFRKMVAIHHVVQKEFLGARAEIARALQSFNIPLEGTSKSKMRALEETLDQFGGAGATKELASKIAAGGLTEKQLAKIVNKSAFARTAGAIREAWTAGLLTSPKTHMRNIFSNAATTTNLAVERYLMAFAPKSEVSFLEANNYVKALFNNQKIAFTNAGKAYKTGETGFGTGKLELAPTRLTSKEEIDATGIFKPFAHAMDYYGNMLSKLSFKALAAGDEYFKTLNYNAQLTALATREAVDAGMDAEDMIKYIDNTLNAPDDILVDQAQEFANYSTFTNQLGQTGQSIQRLISTIPGAKFIIPFFKTPTNIFKFTFERTPFALASSKIRDKIAAGGIQKTEALTRIGMGSAIWGMGTDMAVNGQITGAGPQDKKIRNLLYSQGWKPYSIRIGGKYYSYAGVEPFSTFLQTSSTMAEILTNYESYDIDAQNEIDKVSTGLAVAVIDSTLNKTFLQGISQILEAVNDPEYKFEKWKKNFVSSFVPNIVRDFRLMSDDTMREVNTTLDNLKNKIPGYSKDLPAKRNIWGEEIKYRTPDENILGATLSSISPFYSSVIKDDPLNDYLLRNGLTVNMPQKRLTYDGTTISIKDYPEIYSRLLELRGQEVKPFWSNNQSLQETLRDVVLDRHQYSQFFNMEGITRDEKQDFIDDIVNSYYDEAKELVREEFPVINELILEEIKNTEIRNQL